jgi:integrase
LNLPFGLDGLTKAPLPRGFRFGPGDYFVRREFKPALERAKLPAFRFHDLRHYAVSWLIAQGADIKLLEAIAGHASATVTLDTYGHLMTDGVSEAAKLYDPLRVSKVAAAVDER